MILITYTPAHREDIILMRYTVFIAVVVCILCQGAIAVTQSSMPTNDEQAKQMMKQADHLWGYEHKPLEAIELLRKVVAYNPRLEAHYPEEKLHLRAQSELGHAYMEAGQMENAVAAYDLAEQFAQESGGYEPTILPMMMSRCREKLAAAGKTPAGAMIVIAGWIFRGTSTMVDGVALVSASELAPKMGLRVESDKLGGLTISSTDADNRKVLKMTVDSNIAVGSDKTLQLPVSPRQHSKGILIPLRDVAGYFGAEVKWDAAPKVAWVQ